MPALEKSFESVHVRAGWAQGARRRLGHWLCTLAALGGLGWGTAHAVTIDWVTVGDPGNAGQTLSYSGTSMTFGAVADPFRIMKYEWTNSLYVDYLNAVDPQGTNPNSIYNASMASDPRGGITNTGSTDGSRYAVRTDMGAKPVNFVTWWDAARVANWLHNGGQTYGTSDSSASAPQNTGAYAVGTGTSGSVPAVTAGALFFIPTEDQWYKAAYYRGGGTSAGYWAYATQSDTAPTAVTADSTGVGSAGGTGNFANYTSAADWNGQDGNVTTVGTNGGASAYGTFDMSGNIYEWNDLTGAAGSSRGLRGGNWFFDATYLSSSTRNSGATTGQNIYVGFRLAASPSSPSGIPEIDPSGWPLVMALVVGGLALLERRLGPR
jgi:formylglycine-generating enzyme required for sulfatase activity